MRRRRNKGSSALVIGQIIVLFGILAIFASPSKYIPVVHVVKMQKKTFVPDLTTIKLGDSVLFINKSRKLHNIVVKKLNIRTKYVKKGKHVTITPRKTGEFEYYCQPHRTVGMVGVIKVGK